MNLLRVFLPPIIAVGMVLTAPASDFHDLIAEGYPRVNIDTSNEPQILTFGESL